MINYKPKLVCSSNIAYEIIDNKLYNVKYTGGCDGNLQALAKLVEGLEVEKVISLLEGINCHGRGTSCADQLSQSLKDNISN